MSVRTLGPRTEFPHAKATDTRALLSSSSSAAERRKEVARGVSRGVLATQNRSPAGATDPLSPLGGWLLAASPPRLTLLTPRATSCRRSAADDREFQVTN